MQDFFRRDAAAGWVLGVSALLAVAVSNSGLEPAYRHWLGAEIGVHLDVLSASKPLLTWINDGLMTVFFLLVALEIKRELLGELSSARRLALPLAAAIGGMAVPAAIYAAVNWNERIGISGWAIPTATDIAFALGAMALLGPRVPKGLRLFLTAVAILDDLGAIAIIAAFYTDNLSAAMLWAAAAWLVALILLNRLAVRAPLPYVLAGLGLWACLLNSGVHATLAGVATAFAIPRAADAARESGSAAAAEPARFSATELERVLEPWVEFGILPIFAFANAGLTFAQVHVDSLRQPVTLGIVLGLFAGKPLGVLCGCCAVLRSGIAQMPDGVNSRMLCGAACLCGIGFTMSLFIGSLAFDGAGGYPALLKLGVMLGSVAAGVLGSTVLRIALKGST